jgi:hypothetical protein
MNNIMFFVGFYVVLGGIAVIIVVISLGFVDRRYHKNHGQQIPKGFERTEEVTIDPKNNKKFRVYYNEKTGQRFYHEEGYDSPD